MANLPFRLREMRQKANVNLGPNSWGRLKRALGACQCRRSEEEVRCAAGLTLVEQELGLRHSAVKPGCMLIAVSICRYRRLLTEIRAI
jgi:hypothetical protein